MIHNRRLFGHHPFQNFFETPSPLGRLYQKLERRDGASFSQTMIHMGVLESRCVGRYGSKGAGLERPLFLQVGGGTRWLCGFYPR